ncbi:hypothetical protein N8D56_07950 [Devosia sp. A8/3-2]|nr:hypothetical protein N8D56_07950 [Devosia sp. A8/3-2]
MTVPEEAAGKTFVLKFTSQWQDRPGSTDPQCPAYLDGKIARALDGNHTELVIERNAKPGSKHVLLVNAFTFFERPLVGFTVDFYTRSERAESSIGICRPHWMWRRVFTRMTRAVRRS